MNTINQKVKHKVWGIGTIIELNGNIIEVSFDCGKKKMQYPNAFEQFLIAVDDEFQNYVLELIKAEKERAEAERQARIEEQERLKKALEDKNNKPAVKRVKKAHRENIAFKCNFCDGGSDDNHLGFRGPCSDKLIDYNIEVACHTWCCSDDAPCAHYYDGDITREELDEQCVGDGFVCYESKMLENWRASAGYVVTGENKNKPMKLSKVQINSLAVLTTRFPDTKEKDRFIFGVFLVDDAFEGDAHEEGFVTTTSKYKLELSPEEAEQLKYWNYYYNRNKPEDISWGQGLHRYLDDIQAAQILRDIAEIKKGKYDEKLSKEFFEYFCRINGVDENEIPENEGALLRK